LDADFRVTSEEIPESKKRDAEISPSDYRKQVKKEKPTRIRLTSTSTRIVEPLQLDKKIAVPLDKGRIELRISETPTKPVSNNTPSSLGISLMKMVNPRIIIQEEEEEKLGISETPTKPVPNTATTSSSKSELIMGGVTPRIIIQEEEEEKLGVVPVQ